VIAAPAARPADRFDHRINGNAGQVSQLNRDREQEHETGDRPKAVGTDDSDNQRKQRREHHGWDKDQGVISQTENGARHDADDG
jgi:hypothetical protein